MRSRFPSWLALAVVSVVAHTAWAESSAMRLPVAIEAGTSFSVATAGSGAAVLYIVGPGIALRRNVQLGEPVVFAADDLHNAGRYVAFLVSGGSTQSGQFDVLASRQAATLSFLAKPSRLPVNLTNGLSGVVYVFDVFGNLMLQPQPVTFEFSDATGRTQSRTAATRNGVAWVKMNSATKAGAARFEASTGTVRERRIVQQVAGEPCTLKMSAKRAGSRITLETEPVHDCDGNPVPDGTIVTFTETFGEFQATVDAPLKRGIARTNLPDQNEALISVASGVVMGNEIHWKGGQ